MNCDCINRVQKKLSAFVQDQAGAGATATCLATGYQLDPEFKLVLNIPFQIKGPAKGFNSAKGKTMPVTASYCPFCARSTKHYTVGQDEGLDAAFGFTSTTTGEQA